MKWHIPAKTFLLGEYAAIAEGSALILTTKSCFELSLTKNKELAGIHPQSPAGVWWQQQDFDHGLSWHDPYQGLGGLGASSAQFLGVYLASCHLKNTSPSLTDLLTAYYQSAWSGKGLRPSGYDLIAQSQQGCVFINRQKQIIQSYPWPFKDLAFILIHTGTKLATHNHLQETTLPDQTKVLSNIADECKMAFENKRSEHFIQSIKYFHTKLSQLERVAPHSQELIQQLSLLPEVRAIKGCGAMGADILLLVCASQDKAELLQKLNPWPILATEHDLCNESALVAI